MDIYRYVPDSNNYESMAVVGDEWITLRNLFEGQPTPSGWAMPELDVDSSIGQTGDFPSLRGSIPVLSERAWEKLRGLFGIRTEVHPFTCSSGSYVALNILDIVDCLDQRLSDVTRFRDGRVISISSYSFLSDRVDRHNVFRLRETMAMEVLVSQQFKHAVETMGLKGLVLKKLT